MENIYISKNSLKRLPFYIDYLKKRKALGDVFISSTAIAKGLGLNDVQVRKDLALVSQTGGKPKVGYEIDELLRDMDTFLGVKNINQTILVGVGSLGEALVRYEGFDEYGLAIKGAFDNNPSKIGAKIHDVEIMSVDKIKDFCKEHDIHIGIITVPLKYAQETADILIESGVKAIWNFAPTTLSVPNDILVQNENMASSLAILSRHLNLKMKK